MVIYCDICSKRAFTLDAKQRKAKVANLYEWPLTSLAQSKPSIPQQSCLSCCCCACLSSCHLTASDANYWTIRTLFIASTISCLGETAPPHRSFQISSVLVNFFKFFSTEFATFSKQPSRDDHHKSSYPSMRSGSSKRRLSPFGHAADKVKQLFAKVATRCNF